MQRVLQASGLKYTMHSAGTTVGAFLPHECSFLPSRPPPLSPSFVLFFMGKYAISHSQSFRATCSVSVSRAFSNPSCFHDVYDGELTTLDWAEGNWDEVLAVVGKAHTVVHKRGVVRVQSSMRVGSRYVFFSLFSSSVFPVYYSFPHHTVLLTTAGAGRTRSRRQRTRSRGWRTFSRRGRAECRYGFAAWLR